MVEFLDNYGIKLLRFAPYNAQASGKADSSNKVLIGILQKMIEENPKDWHIL